MSITISNNKSHKRHHTVAVDENMKTHENDPYFVKKTEEVTAFIKKVGLPKYPNNTHPSSNS